LFDSACSETKQRVDPKKPAELYFKKFRDSNIAFITIIQQPSALFIFVAISSEMVLYEQTKVVKPQSNMRYPHQQQQPRQRRSPTGTNRSAHSPLSSSSFRIASIGIVVTTRTLLFLLLLLRWSNVESSTRRSVSYGTSATITRHRRSRVDGITTTYEIDRDAGVVGVAHTQNKDGDSTNSMVDDNYLHIIPAAWNIESTSTSTSTSSFKSKIVYNEPHQPQHEPNEEDDDDCMEYDEDVMIVKSMLPNMKIQDMSLVLQYTSLVNDQLQQQSYYHYNHKKQNQECLLDHQPTPPQYKSIVQPQPAFYEPMECLRGGAGEGLVGTKIQTRSDSSHGIPFTRQNEGTLDHPSAVAMAFHSSNEPTHTLHDYLSNVMKALQQQPQRQADNKEDEQVQSYTTSLERTLMMLYLDRACCSRVQPFQYIWKLPFCTPSNVHALCVTAMLVAAGAIRGSDLLLFSTNVEDEEDNHNNGTDEYQSNTNHGIRASNVRFAQSFFMQSLYRSLEEEMGIPATVSQHRVLLMLQALQPPKQRRHRCHALHMDGAIDIDVEDDDIEEEDDSGIFVTPSALQEWKEQWEARFAL
jgi:hypothetical protein